MAASFTTAKTRRCSNRGLRINSTHKNEKPEDVTATLTESQSGIRRRWETFRPAGNRSPPACVSRPNGSSPHVALGKRANCPAQPVAQFAPFGIIVSAANQRSPVVPSVQVVRHHRPSFFNTPQRVTGAERIIISAPALRHSLTDSGNNLAGRIPPMSFRWSTLALPFAGK